MVTIIRVLKLAVLVLLALAMTVTSWLHMLGWGVERSLLNPAYYRGLLKAVDIPGHLRSQVSAQVGEGEEMPEEMRGVLLDGLDAALDPEWLSEQLLLALDDIIPYVKGERATMTAVLDLTVPKARFQQAVAGWETTGPDMMGAEDPVEGLLQGFPDQFSLAELTGEIPPEIFDHLAVFQRGRRIFLIAPYFLLGGFLVLQCLLAGPTGGAKWFGATALLAGLFFAAGLLIGGRVFAASSLFIPAGLPIEPTELQGAVDLTLRCFSRLPLTYALGGLLLLAGGIVLGRMRGGTVPA